MYGDSYASSSDSCTIFPSNSKPKEELAAVNRDQQLLFMESATDKSYSEFKQQFSGNNNGQNNSGLLRLRSAPTSMLANFTTGSEKSKKSGSRFYSDKVNSMHVVVNDGNSGQKGSVNRSTAMNSQLPPQYPRQSGGKLGSLTVDGGGSYRVVSSIGPGEGKFGSSLVRQNSSPAGLFSHLTSQNGYAGVRGIGSYSMVDAGGDGDLIPSSSRFKNHMNFPSGLPGMLSRITEVDESGRPNCLDDVNVGNSSGDNLFFSSGFPFGSWNDSSYFADNFTSGIKRELDNDPELFVNSEKCETGSRPNILSHHLSLSKTPAEMAAMERLFQLQDTIPCKVRAKRGCATHPRSIAERARRTRISERMRKLQKLVPNMDKQTSTADMLDLAVEYIKNLRKQYKTLSDNRANCKCSAFQKVVSDQIH